MNTLRSGIVLAASILGLSSVHAQQATEVYIPIGESPGVSAATSVTGTITSVDYAALSIDIRTSAGSKTARMDDKTWYYLDRSKRRTKSVTGSMEDCKVGRSVEVRFAADGQVEWIKIASD